MNSLLDNVRWKEFKVSEYFVVENSKPYHKESLTSSDEGIPYITRTSLNNGLEDIIEPSDDFVINSGNAISFGAENADFFYHSKDFITGNKMYVVRHEKMNKNIGLFLVQAFSQSIKGCGFGYGKGLTGTRFKTRVVMLPEGPDGEPYWDFMDNYIEQKQIEKVQRLIEYYEERLIEPDFEVADLEDVEWDSFLFTDLFDLIKRGRRLTKSNQVEGETPYISSTAMNNGIDGFIGNKDRVRRYENNLTLANSGSVGSCFYHPYEYIASDHVTALGLRNKDEADKYVYLFIGTIVKRLENKYSFNREISDKRAKRERIILPTKDDKPDWDYMRKYMRKIEFKEIKKILKYLYKLKSRHTESIS